MVARRYRLIPVLALFLVVACRTAGPEPTMPTLTLTPTSINVNAGDAVVTFTATVQNSTEGVTWAYTGPGEIAPPGGSVTSYTPPASVESIQTGSLTATLGATGVSATAAIVIYPADVTPPPEPPPPSELTVTVAEVAPVTLSGDGTVSVSLNASTSNAPSGVSYKWTAQGNNPGTVSFASDTAEDTPATISGGAGVFVVTLTATAGSETATDTLSITVRAAPSVSGSWTGSYTDPETGASADLTLELAQTGEAVTGTLNDLPVEGTFSGDTLELDYTGTDGNLRIEATVSGEAMAGEYLTGETLEQVYPFTAMRQQP